jgi:hypothetical protein
VNTPNNILKFNNTVATIFELLYDDFPDPVDLGPDHFDLKETAVDGTKVWRDESYQTVLATVRWLRDEGYIRLIGYSNGICQATTLSQKGLLVLNAIPDSLSPTETIGKKIKDAIATGSRSMVSKAIDQAFDFGIKYATGQTGN